MAPQAGPWRVAAYIRLSREDGNDESLSVVNQKKIIAEFLAASFQGEYILCGQYVDDGVSGTDYDRPEFQRMLQDIRTGRINCVVCKNLSRAFRNYSDQGYFLESFFPLHGTRFIALGEPRVDSFLNPEMIHGLEIPISGLMNDRYAAKTSSDIRRTFDTKRRRGEFIGAFAPYGYRKDPENRNRLLPDGEAAQVVRHIFVWYAQEGLSSRGIALRLNDLGIPNPTAYKRAGGLRYENPHASSNDGLWCAKTVRDILHNRVYVGDMVQGRQRVVSYKVHDRLQVPPEDWFIAVDTQEPLIERSLFDAVQALSAKKARVPPGGRAVYPLSGFVRCASCGRAMHRHAAKGYVYYQCRTYQDKGGRYCGKHAIRADFLERAVLTALQTQIARLENLAALAEALRRTPAEPGSFERLDKLLQQRVRELERLQAVRDELYLDWKSGAVTREDYLRIGVRLEHQSAQLEQVVRRLQKALSESADTASARSPNLTSFLERATVEELDRGLLAALVDTILVGDNSVEIRFRFSVP